MEHASFEKIKCFFLGWEREWCFSNGSSKICGSNSRASWYGRRSPRCGIGTHAITDVGSPQIAEITEEKLPTSVGSKATTQSKTAGLCLGTRAMCDTTRKFSTRWKVKWTYGGTTGSKGINSKFSPTTSPTSILDHHRLRKWALTKMANSQTLPAMTRVLSKFAASDASFPLACACFLPLVVVLTNRTPVSYFSSSSQIFYNVVSLRVWCRHRRGSNFCRRGEARRNHCQLFFFFHHESDGGHHFPSKLTGDRLRTSVATYQWQEVADWLGHAGEEDSSALYALYNIILDGPRDCERLVAGMEQQGFGSQDASDALKEWADVYLIVEVREVVRFWSDEDTAFKEHRYFYHELGVGDWSK